MSVTGLNQYVGVHLPLPYQRGVSDPALITYSSQSASQKNARHYGKGGFSSFRPGSYGGGAGSRGGKKRLRDGTSSKKYAAPTPKCFTVSSGAAYSITTTLSSIQGSYTPMAMPVNASVDSRTGFTVSCSRLNLFFNITRGTSSVGDATALIRVVIALATKGDCLTASQMFTDVTVWNPILLPVATSAGYVILHDDVYHVDCVPNQIVALNAAPWYQLISITRNTSISLDMRNILATYSSNTTAEPVTNVIRIYMQASAPTISPYNLTLRSSFYFYDY